MRRRRRRPGEEEGEEGRFGRWDTFPRRLLLLSLLFPSAAAPPPSPPFTSSSSPSSLPPPAPALASASCPEPCSCKWRRGKETVDCAGAGMRSIPVMGPDAGTQVLNMAGNPLGSLSEDAFSSANLLNLQQVVASDCGLASVAARAFHSLINLVELDLSYNLLSEVPSDSFGDLSQLRELRLSGNPLGGGSGLFEGAFADLPALIRLELSGCGLRAIQAGAFDGLDQLQWLRLDGNLLSQLSPAPLRPLRALHGVDLHGNPFNCSCGLRELRLWMLGANVPSVTPAAPTCASPPRLMGRAWDGSLGADEFACPPRVEDAGVEDSSAAGANVTLFCRARGVPRPAIRWTWQGQTLRNGSRARAVRFVIADGDSGSQFEEEDVAVSRLYVMHQPITTPVAAGASSSEEEEEEEEEDRLSGTEQYVCHASNPAGSSRVAVRTTVFLGAFSDGKPPASSVKGNGSGGAGGGDDVAEASSEQERVSYVIAAFGGCAVIFLTLFFVCCVYSVRQKPSLTVSSSSASASSCNGARQRYFRCEDVEREEGGGGGASSNRVLPSGERAVVLQVRRSPGGALRTACNGSTSGGGGYKKVVSTSESFEKVGERKSDSGEDSLDRGTDKGSATKNESSSSDQGYKSVSSSSSVSFAAAGAASSSGGASRYHQRKGSTSSSSSVTDISKEATKAASATAKDPLSSEPLLRPLSLSKLKEQQQQKRRSPNSTVPPNSEKKQTSDPPPYPSAKLPPAAAVAAAAGVSSSSSPRVRFNLKPINLELRGLHSSSAAAPFLNPLRLRSPSDPMVSFLPPEEEAIAGARTPDGKNPHRASAGVTAAATTRVNRRVRFRTRSTSADRQHELYLDHEEEFTTASSSATAAAAASYRSGEDPLVLFPPLPPPHTCRREQQQRGKAAEGVDEGGRGRDEEYRLWSQGMAFGGGGEGKEGTRPWASSRQNSLPGRGKRVYAQDGREHRWSRAQTRQRSSYHEGDAYYLSNNDNGKAAAAATASSSFFASPCSPPASYDASESDITTSSAEQQQQQQSLRQQYQQKLMQQQQQQQELKTAWRHSVQLPPPSDHRSHHHPPHHPAAWEAGNENGGGSKFQYHSAQLDRFLGEYRELQGQLSRMREACDGLRQVNLRRDLEELRTAILELEARCERSEKDGGVAAEGGGGPVAGRAEVADLRRRYEVLDAALAPKPILKPPGTRSNGNRAALVRSMSAERTALEAPPSQVMLRRQRHHQQQHLQQQQQQQQQQRSGPMSRARPASTYAAYANM